MTRALRFAAALAFCLASVGACSSGPPPDLSFRYTVFGEPYNIDQTVMITNPRTDEAAIPTLEFEPQDAHQVAIPGLTVESLFGSTKGRLLVPPGSAFDILRFTGDRAADVRTVSVKTVSVRWAPFHHPETVVPTLEFVDASGAAMTKFDDFAAIDVPNPNDFEIKVGVLYIVWTDPGLPPPQQAAQTAMFDSPITVAPHKTSRVQLNEAVKAAMAARGENAAVSVKVFLVP